MSDLNETCHPEAVAYVEDDDGVRHLPAAYPQLINGQINPGSSAPRCRPRDDQRPLIGAANETHEIERYCIQCSAYIESAREVTADLKRRTAKYSSYPASSSPDKLWDVTPPVDNRGD